MEGTNAEALLLDNTLSPSAKNKALLSLKKDELKQCVSKKNLVSTGTKQDLVRRLLDNSKMNGNGEAAAAAGSNGDGPATRSKTSRQRTQSESRRKDLKEERKGIVLWKRPFTTLYYGTAELLINVRDWCSQMLEHRITLVLLSLLVGCVTVARRMEGPHQETLSTWEAYLVWCAWWVGLGVLSSVGLGTGLHTFLLYLGPHIASVTLAAYECGSTDFPSPPYPDSIVCPEQATDGGSTQAAMTIWQIVSKVRVEAFCWGFGTALGELPPYFMARAHRLSGHDPEEDDDDSDDEEREFLELKKKNPDELSSFDRAKLKVENIVEKMGFFGILACASIPNPLFDLAGITCGHFLVPFWTFFGATVIGKAIIKMNIQKMFIILAFNEKLIAYAVDRLHTIPVIGAKLEGPFKQALALQKEKLHRKSGTKSESAPLLGQIFEKLVLAMVAYFVVSILNSLAQSYHKRIHKETASASGKRKKSD